jgi:cytoskeletal protein CcmA (bactofilin family)
MMPFKWLANTDAGQEWCGFLDRGVRLEGKLECPGTIRIDSFMKGTIVSSETLIIGESAVVEGLVEATSVVVGGRFEGTIKAKSKVEVQNKAIVRGEIFTSCLVMEPGALLDGQCHMWPGSDGSKPITIPIRTVTAQV